jgi:signal transduction histidine kinase
LHSDPELVRMVLTNLINNAIKFTERGEIVVCVEHDDGCHRVVVKDTGPGIPPEERTRIFEPFEHIEPTRHKHTPGVGLGLALVREMASALGGRIDLESEPGRGSEFTVFLPSAAN